MDRVRIVEDRSVETKQFSPDLREGTQVLTDASQAVKESILPLEGALAHSLSQSLCPLPYRLFVEGVHDLLFLRTMSGIIIDSGGRGLDPRWTIAPLGGSTNIPLLATLAGSENTEKQVCLVDSAPNIPNDLMSEYNLYTYDAYTDTDDAGIEDLLDEDFYIELINAAYTDALTRPISRKQLSRHGGAIATQVSDIIQSCFRDSEIRYDRLKPAQYFAAFSAEVRGSLSQETLQRFAKLFEMVNSNLV
jgi:hypothetical protein